MLRIAAIMLLAALPAAAIDPPADFSGVWKMDATRSESAHQAEPIGPITMIVKQTGNEIRIETQRRNPRKTLTRTEILHYKLDGSETANIGRDGVAVKSRAHWDGANLVTETERNIEAASITTMYVHSLDPEGKEMTIRKTLTVQHGYQFEGAKNIGTGTDVFIKVKPSGSK